MLNPVKSLMCRNKREAAPDECPQSCDNQVTVPVATSMSSNEADAVLVDSCTCGESQEASQTGLNEKQLAELDWWVQSRDARPRNRLWATKCAFQLIGPTLGLADLDAWYAYLQDKTMLDLCCGPEPWEPAVRPAALIYYDWLVEGYDLYDMLRPEKGQVYVAGPAEKMPFAKNSFDFVHFENALDHVDEPRQTVAELKRVTRPGGLVYLGVDIGGVPSECEPHVFERCDLDALFEGFELLGEQMGLPDKPAYNPVDKQACLRRLYRVID